MSTSSQSQTCYQEAIRVNNLAVHQFEKGKYEEARLLFRDALRALRNSSINEKRSHFTDDNRSGKRSNIEFKWSKYAPFHSKLDLPTPTPETPYIFRKALLIEESSIKKTMLTTSINYIVDEEIKAIIYNLALSYLYSGFVNRNPTLKKKARQLFAKIINFIPDFPPRQIVINKRSYEDQLVGFSFDMECLNSEIISDRSNVDRYPKNASYKNVFSWLENSRMESFESHEVTLTLS